MSGVLCGVQWSFKRFVMSTDDRRSLYRRSVVSAGEHVRHGANSSVDPSISSTRASKDVSGNARSQPKADLDHCPSDNYHSSHQNSYHGNHQLSGEDGSRKRKHATAVEEGSGEDKAEDVWTEHMSSKGRVYYYNQLTTKSQWTKPLTGIIKKSKDVSSTENTSSKSSVGHYVKSSGSNRPSPREHTAAPSTHGSSSKAVSSSTPTLKGSPITSHKSPWQQREHRKSSSSSATPDMASPTYRQRSAEVGRSSRQTTSEPGTTRQTHTESLVNRQRSADGLVNRQKGTDAASKELQCQLPPQVQELHPLQQAFLLQTQFAQSTLMTVSLEGGRKDEGHTQDGDGIVSMETSPTDSNSAELEGGVIQKGDLGIYSSVGSTSHHDSDSTHSQLQQQAFTQDQLLLPVATTPPVSDLSSSIRSTPALQLPSLLLAPNVVYNPIADLPAHLREPLPPTPPGSECFAPHLAEFWLTPAHEMLEKQIHQSSHEFLFKTVSSTRRLGHLLAKADIQSSISGLVSESRSLRVQSLKKASKDVGDLK